MLSREQEWSVNCLKWQEQRKPASFSLMKLMLLEVAFLAFFVISFININLICSFILEPGICY